MGHYFKDSTVQEGIKLLSFKIAQKPGEPLVSVKVRGEVKQSALREVPSTVLVVMKETAENYPGKKVGHAVMTVGAYFSDVQQQSTKNAGVVAAFHVLRIISESISTAIAYGLHKRTEKSTLVNDLTDGTSDVLLMTIDNHVTETVATNGNIHLSSVDFSVCAISSDSRDGTGVVELGF